MPVKKKWWLNWNPIEKNKDQDETHLNKIEAHQPKMYTLAKKKK
jgi:hypothetical protein